MSKTADIPFPNELSRATAAMWLAEPPELLQIKPPAQLWVPLALGNTLASLASLPPGTRVKTADPLISFPPDSSHIPLAPFAGTIGEVKQVHLTSGRAVMAVQLIVDPEVDADVDAKSKPSPPALEAPTAESPDSPAAWIDHLRRAGVGADRRCSPDLIGQLHSALSHPPDTVICTVLDTDAALRLSGALAVRFADDLVSGVNFLTSICGADRGVIGKEAYAAAPWVNPLRLAMKSTDLELVELSNDYPQADPTLMVFSITSRRLGPTQLPTSAGVLLVDAAAAIAVGQARRGQIMRCVPVAIHDHTTRSAHATHFLSVPIGTPLKDLLEQCAISDHEIIVRSGDLLGDHRIDPHAIIAGAELTIHVTPLEVANNPDPCIRSGWCIDICPTRVQPAKVLEAAQMNDPDMAKEAGIHACIECGLCTHVCPSRLPLLEGIRMMRRAEPHIESNVESHVK